MASSSQYTALSFGLAGGALAILGLYTLWFSKGSKVTLKSIFKPGWTSLEGQYDEETLKHDLRRASENTPTSAIVHRTDLLAPNRRTSLTPSFTHFDRLHIRSDLFGSSSEVNTETQDHLSTSAPTPPAQAVLRPRASSQSLAVPDTPTSMQSSDGDGFSIFTSSTVPPSYHTRGSTDDLRADVSAAVPPLPSPISSLPRSPPPSYGFARNVDPPPSAFGRGRRRKGSRPRGPRTSEAQASTSRARGQEGGREGRARKKSTDGGVRLDGGPLGTQLPPSYEGS